MPQRELQAKKYFSQHFSRFALEAWECVYCTTGGFLFLQRGSGSSVIPLLERWLDHKECFLCFSRLFWLGKFKSWSASLAAVVEMLEQPLPKDLIVSKPLSFEWVFVWRKSASSVFQISLLFCRELI